VRQKYRSCTTVITLDRYDHRSYNVNVPEFQGCYTFGRSLKQAIQSGKEVIDICLDSGERKIGERKPRR